MTFDQTFCYSFSFSSPIFLGGKRKGGKNNQSRGQKAYLSAEKSGLKICCVNMSIFYIYFKIRQIFSFHGIFCTLNLFT